MQWITFVSEGNEPIPDLPKCSLFIRIIRDPASPTEEASVSFFNASL